jgi:hypothetical protein
LGFEFLVEGEDLAVEAAGLAAEVAFGADEGEEVGGVGGGEVEGVRGGEHLFGESGDEGVDVGGDAADSEALEEDEGGEEGPGFWHECRGREKWWGLGPRRERRGDGGGLGSRPPRWRS